MQKIYLVGNPNVGKTSLFNILTGAKESVGNYSGTTITEKERFSLYAPYQIIDLAGMYNFDLQKEEEHFAWKKIEEAMEENIEKKNIIFVQVIAQKQWKKSLSLTIDLQKKGISPILFFNTKKNDIRLKNNFYIKLEKEFNLPVFYGDIYKKNFREYFWQKFKTAQDKILHNNQLLPKTFSSYEEQQSYIENIFGPYIFPTKNTSKKKSISQFLDNIFIHSFFGVLAFFIMIYFVFFMTFTIGAIPMDWIDAGTSFVQEIVKNTFGENIFSVFLADGVIAGAGGTLIFLPNIIILFFFLALLRESGYLARSSFLFNSFFQKIGLSGRASIPLLMGFGCNVPSIMAIKSFETRKEQIIVAMMTLFMSCGARLPVYTLIISAVIPQKFQAISLFSIYFLGIFVSFMTGKILQNTYKRGKNRKLIAYEIPQLIFPNIKRALEDAFRKGKLFIIKVGKFIVPVSIGLWLFFTFPIEKVHKDGIEASYGASIGKTLQPIFEPMHFDWKISTALLSGVTAKEVMVTTFAELYHANSSDESLQENIKNSVVFTIPVALAFLVFVLLYTPCLAVVGTIRAELGNFWSGFAIVYPFIVAWIFSFLTFTITRFFLF